MNDSIIYEINEKKVEVLKIDGDFSKFFYKIKDEVKKELEKDKKDLYNLNKFFKYSEKFLNLKDGKSVIMNNI